MCEALLLSYELVSVINIFSDTFQQSYSDKQNYLIHNERKTVIIKASYNYYRKKKNLEESFEAVFNIFFFL